MNSRFPRGKRGLKFIYTGLRNGELSRFPRGKRGLKFMKVYHAADFHPRRFPRGKRGLKFSKEDLKAFASGRFPRGKRGLKSEEEKAKAKEQAVASLAGSVD